MDMPEGWKRYERICGFSKLPDSCKAAELLKEMALALEKYADEFCYEPSDASHKELKRVLQKFKEWK